MGETKKKGQVRKGRDLEKWKNNRPQAPSGCVRVIGGIYRGVSLVYSGDQVTRPMKDNVREALFNLVGGYLENTICFDLFAGTGAVGLEALSRKAHHSVLVERHVPTSKIIRQNVETLKVESNTTICCSDSFYWVRQFFRNLERERSELESLDFEQLTSRPWAVFCCPPYDLYESAWDDLQSLILSFQQACPPGSLIVVESDSRFDPGQLPESEKWDSRQYSPAVLSVWRKSLAASDSESSQKTDP